MATGKRYFWIKLKESFMNSDTVDYLMSLPDGANYVVLYQMLCLKTINTDGRLSRQIGEIIIPYNVEKIQRDCKYFSADTIHVALKLFQSFGLIYEDVDGTLVLTDHQNLVGSETDWAVKKRRQIKDTSSVSLPPSGGESGGENFPTEIDIRDRDKEIRDKEIRDRNIEDTTTSRACAREEPIGIAIDAYERRFGRFPTEIIIDDMRKYLEQMEPEVIAHAIELAVTEGFFKWSYVRGVVDRYIGMNVKTLAAAEACDQEYREFKKNRSNSKRKKRPYGGEPLSPEERAKQERDNEIAMEQIRRLREKINGGSDSG